MIVHSQRTRAMTTTLERPDPELAPRDMILMLARTAFAEKGFDGASMQDLARAAGMSAGNFYRYFPSKAAIVQAFITREMAMIDAGFVQIAGARDPVAAIHAMIRSRISGEMMADCALWAEIVAVAHRQPDIAQLLHKMEETAIGHMTGLFATLKNMAVADAHARYATRARLMVLLVRGVEMESLHWQTPDTALIDMVIAEVTRMTTDILSDRT
jgi:AcrR family transcriptional regulator